MLVYFALGFMVLTVLSNRFWRSQLNSARVSLTKLKESSDAITKEVADAAREYATLSHQYAETEKRAAKAEQEMNAVLGELEVKKAAAIDRYYVFDRLEPRPGRFYEAAVRYDPAAGERPAHRAWTGVRRHIMIAETEREARERIAARFPRKLGFEVVEVAACRLANLQVNRIAELSTFKRPGSGEDEDAPRRTPRRASSGRT
ncbi:MAG TPA: hypothetical protein VGE72_05090 [Azospirillum sp.]